MYEVIIIITFICCLLINEHTISIKNSFMKRSCPQIFNDIYKDGLDDQQTVSVRYTSTSNPHPSHPFFDDWKRGFSLLIMRKESVLITTSGLSKPLTDHVNRIIREYTIMTQSGMEEEQKKLLQEQMSSEMLLRDKRKAVKHKLTKVR